ncbi:carbohydrate binding family 9 domain-containing protein [Flavihumibacter sp. R14]|nr:carbohydrate binding family 9 domain-containing protein [Flavihumibacter soli]
MKKILLFALLGFANDAFCYSGPGDKVPEVKKMSAVRIDRAPKIDGVLEDDIWKNIPAATDFTELRPVPGRKAKAGQETLVKIAYDDSGIYIGARMNELTADSIARELAPRDRVGNADFIGVIFDTYLDKINGNGFFVTAAGSQFDAKYSNGGNEDELWNAVWDSDVKIDDKGWTVEMRIPYSALRFSSKDVQKWGVNMVRMRQKVRQQSFWNPIDPNNNGFINQGGELTGIANVKSPVRLSFSPYVSSYLNNYPSNLAGVKNTTGSFNGGMDIKYGINQSFTLDMTLVPDFGQVQSDNQVLNLTPFEVQYDENRQFFTEGTELFSKGDLFYSRRIGSNPNYLANVTLAEGEKFIKNPIESKLLNATKISGRTSKGLGIGFFNALTNRMETIIEDAAGNRRSVETQPLTNFNIFVLDQTLKNNSSISFINTNVLRKGAAFDANVTAVDFSFNDKKNVWNIKGTGKMSNITAPGTATDATGYSYNLKFGKQSGKFQYNFLQQLTDDKFSPNDLGILNNNNFFNNSVFGEINLYKGKKVYNELHAFIQARYSQRFTPRSYQTYGLYSGIYMELKNLWYIEANAEWEPEGNDFYESRNGMVFKKSAYSFAGLALGSNRAKKYNAGVFAYVNAKKQFDGRGYDMGFYQNLRFNNKFSIGNDLSYEPRFNYAGWVGKIGPEETPQTIFSRFDRQTIENSFDAKYSFNTKMGLTLVARHYWSTRQNKEFFTLDNDGRLSPAGVDNNYDVNFNTFNIDMNYIWQFAPGSQLTVTWKDVSSANEDAVLKGYSRNLDHIFNTPQNNSLSLKVLYYIDYLQLKQLRKKG